MVTTPALRGILIKYNWSELETSKDVYNFKSIKARLAELVKKISDSLL